MNKLSMTLLIILALGVAFIGSVFLASEIGGEVVTLQTYEADGHPETTRLWIVDFDGLAWLRAGMPTSSWFVRIEADDRVLVERGGEASRFRAVPVREAEVRDRVHALMREKYGLADRWISMLRDDTASVPVRLEPRNGV